MTTLNISLPDAMREWIEDQLKSGGYGNASEYIRGLIPAEEKRVKSRRVVIRPRAERDVDEKRGAGGCGARDSGFRFGGQEEAPVSREVLASRLPGPSW